MRAKPKGYPRKTSHSNPTPRPATSAASSGASAILPSKSSVPSPKSSVAIWPPSVAGCPFRMSNFSQPLPQPLSSPGLGFGWFSTALLQLTVNQEPISETTPRGHAQTPRRAGPSLRRHGSTLRLDDPTPRRQAPTPRRAASTLRRHGATPRPPAPTPRLSAPTPRRCGSTPRRADPTPRRHAPTPGRATHPPGKNSLPPPDR